MTCSSRACIAGARRGPWGAAALVIAALTAALPATAREGESREPRSERSVRESSRGERGGGEREGARMDARSDRASEPREDRVGSGAAPDSRAAPAADNDAVVDKDAESASGGDEGDDRDDRDATERAGRVDAALHGLELERGLDGHERRRGELLLLGDAAAVATVRRAGNVVLSERALPSLGRQLARLQLPRGEALEAAIARVQALVPKASVSAHHIYWLSGDAAGTSPAAKTAKQSPKPVASCIGIIDTGADLSAPGLAPAVIAHRSFTGYDYVPRQHGSTVAAIATRHGAPVAVADVFGPDSKRRLVAPVDAIAGALDWLVAQKCRVINISIEGPQNDVVAGITQRALKRGVALVAAAGNSGPSAAPAYPAAYPGVVAVTAVDQQGKVYRRANRGDYISFAARGVGVHDPLGDERERPVSGTSYAAPLVAAEIARGLARRSDTPQAVLKRLQRQAVDRGPDGWDPVYGWGEVVPSP